MDYAYYLDGLVQRKTEKRADGTLVNDHQVEYDPNGNRASDVTQVMNADNHAAMLSYTAAYTYDPRDRTASVRKTGGVTTSEDYVHDAANNVISETINTATITHTYDRNRLVKTDGDNQAYTTYDYDPFGRLETVRGLYYTDRYVYDGFDRVFERQRTLHPPNPGQTTTRFSYDPLDRTVRTVIDPGTATEKTTTFDHLGLSDLVESEQTPTSTNKYQFGRGGERLDLIRTATGATAETSYYTYNAHSDVEALTDETGTTRATYGYTAYGKDDSPLITGVDKPDEADPDKLPYNTYRFNAKPLEASTGTYDMGFRDYDPAQSRFLTRDSYSSADADMGLTTNPWTMNRYAFGGGNPINIVEQDGHIGCGLFGLNCKDTPLNDVNDDGYVTPGDIAQNMWSDQCQGMSTWQGQAACGGVAPGIGAITDLAADLGPLPIAQAMKCPQGSWSGCVWTGVAAVGVVADAAGAAGGVGTAAKASRSTANAAARGGNGVANAAVRVGDNLAETAAFSCSFEGSTLVLMVDGTHKPIDEVEIGDEVIASDPETGEQEAHKVTHVFVHQDMLTNLELDGGTTLGTTEDHPFWSVTDQAFKRADELAAGEKVLTADGGVLTVGGLAFSTSRKALAYNLEVDGIHTYHVGEQEVLVHNLCRTFARLTPSGVIPDARGVYVIEMTNGKVYVGSATLNNTIHRRLHRAFTDSRHAVASAGYKVSDVAQIRTIILPGGSPAQIHKMEQALIDSYGGWRGSRLLNRSNVPSVP